MLEDKHQQELKDTRDLGSIIALLVLVFVAYVSIFLDAKTGNNVINFSPLALTVMMCSGFLYCFFILQEDAFLAFWSGKIGLAGYFATQFTLVVLIGVSAQVQGQWWLMALPVLGSSAVFGWRWMVGTGLAAIAAIALGYVFVYQAWWPVWEVPLYSTPAVVFVLIFSRIASNERQSRQKIETLAIELRDANQKLSEYAAKVEELATMKERNRMAREIHDSLGHYLTVVNVQIGAARAIMAQNPVRAEDALQKAQKLTQEGLQEVRQSVRALREDPTETRPLLDNLRGLVEASNSAGIPTELTVKGEPRPLPHNIERTLYRAVQEGLTNTRKYAQASHAAIHLSYEENPSQVTLGMTDDGLGSADPTGGYGLLGMRERVQLLGGKMAIQTAPQEGFHLTVQIPTDEVE